MQGRVSLRRREPPSPRHRVAFVFTGGDHEPASIHVEGMPVFAAELTMEDSSTEFSGATECLLAGRYEIRVKIGQAEGVVYLDVSQQTTIYLSARNGMMEFNIWGPDAPGLD
mgnify:FL=1